MCEVRSAKTSSALGEVFDFQKAKQRLDPHFLRLLQTQLKAVFPEFK